MAFWASGAAKSFAGLRGDLGWDNGELVGYPPFVEELTLRAERLNGTAVGPVEGPCTVRDHLRSGISAAILIADFFERDGFQVWGDVPEREPLDADAIG